MAAKKCLICNSPFRGRVDAKTCSPRCRKRLQQLRFSLAHGELPANKPGGWRRAALLFIVGLFGILSMFMAAGAPQRVQALTASSYLNFQGRLLNAGGAVVPDGNYNIDFRLYNTSNGTITGTGGSVGTCTGACLWEESHLVAATQAVSVTNGYYSVNLGAITSFPSTINWDQQLYITMNVTTNGTTSCTPASSCTWDGEMQSGGTDIALTSVPLAFRANQLALAGTNEQILQFASSTFGQATTISLQDPGATTANLCYETGTAVNHTCAAATGGSGYIQNATGGPQSANFNIISSASGSIGAIIHANASQSVDIFDIDNSSSTVYFGIGSNGSLSSSPADTGTISLGTATETGQITIGQATTATTQTISIESANGTASTQTVNIAGGSSTTSGGKVVNIANGTPGSSTTNTVAIGTGGTTTGTVGITIGSNGAAAHTLVLQGGNGTGTTNAAIKIQPNAAGDIFLGSTAATGTIIVGSSSSANNVQIANGSGASAVVIANVQNGGSVSIGAGMTTGTISLGGASQTGTITLGSATSAATQTISIESANGTSSTQSVEIGGGSSATSGGKVVNIANGIPGTSTTNTVAIGTGGSTTGTVGITIGSATAANHTLLLQGGNVNTAGSEAIRLQTSAAGGIAIGTATHTGSITLGNSTSGETINIAAAQIATGNTTTIHIGDSATGTGKDVITIGNNNGASSISMLVGTGSFSLDGATSSTYAIGASASSGTITLGGTSTTGTITIGKSTSTNTISIGSANRADLGQTVNIANGTITGVNGGQINVNIASGTINGGSSGAALGVSIANGSLGNSLDVSTVNIAAGNTAGAGVVNVTIGSAGALGNTLLLQGGNGATAIQLTQGSGGTITIGSTTGASAVIIQSGTGDITFKGHLKSTQTTAPTIGTPTNCGTSPTAAVASGSTDSAGSFRITAGTGSPTTCDTVVTFNATYTSTPKSILVVAETQDGGTGTAAARQIYVSAASATTFTLKMNSAPAASEVNWFYYWVIK